MSTLNIIGRNTRLELPPVVIQPITTTRLLAKHMPDVQGKTALDLGCGAGPIAVYAALCGAKKSMRSTS